MTRESQQDATGGTQEDHRGSPDLTVEEIQRTEEQTTLNAEITFEVIRRRGEEELARPTAALFFSGLAAGLSMGFSLVAEGLLQTYLPDADWTRLVSKLGYSVGFVMITLGSQQLFTENTLTAVIPVLAKKNRSALVHMLRLWGVVLLANLLGAVAFAWTAAETGVFHPAVKESFHILGLDAAEGAFGILVIQGVFAGWLIALMVWMLPATRGGGLGVIVLLTYLIGLGGFPHIIAGSVEVLYAAISGGVSWGDYLFRYAPATLLGNVLGGVALVTALNYAQVFAGGAARNPATVRPPPPPGHRR